MAEMTHLPQSFRTIACTVPITTRLNQVCDMGLSLSALNFLVFWRFPVAWRPQAIHRDLFLKTECFELMQTPMENEEHGKP